MRRIVLCDIDHTLSNAFWRDSMIGGPGGWDEYHSYSIGDEPIHDMINLINALRPKFKIVGITARPDKWRQLTMNWLLKHGVMIDDLLMRPDINYRPAPEVKMELAQQHINLDNVAFILDDREDVVAAFKAAGVTALQVHGRMK